MDDIARLAGVSRDTLYRWFKLEVLEDYMIEGLNRAKIHLTENGRQLSYAKTMQSNPEAPKPYYANVNTSAGLSLITTNVQTKASEYIDVPNSGAEFFINVFGDSMYPKYCAGEIVGLKKIAKEFIMPGHAYVVELKNGESYIKYIRKGSKKDHWILASENKHYEDMEFHEDKFSAVYVIKMVMTKTTM